MNISPGHPLAHLTFAMNLAILSLALSLFQGSSATSSDGSYLGQTPPGSLSELFAPGIVNTAIGTRDMAITPDGNEIYFCHTALKYQYGAIFVTRLVNGQWSKPKVASFSGSLDWIDIEPALSIDGKKLLFHSTRPTEPGGENAKDLWAVDRKEDGSWGEAYNLGKPINSEGAEFFPSLTRDGTLFFSRSVPGSRIEHIYRSRAVGGVYEEPVRLPETVNGGRTRFNAWVAPDKSHMIVPTMGRNGNFGGVDYWVSFNEGGDNWKEPINLGPIVNDGSRQCWSPYVSPDAKYFFFQSGRSTAGERSWPESWSTLQAVHTSPGGGWSAMYWMPAGFISELEKGGALSVAGVAKKPSIVTEPPTFPHLSGPYLGQELPGMDPVIFAPEVVSTGLNERDIMMSQDGNQIWFGLLDLGRVTMLTSRLENGQWTEPTTPSFHLDGDSACLEPSLSPDGQTLLFLSNRAAPGQTSKPGWGNQNIFRTQRTATGWTEASALPEPITSAQAEYFPSQASDGTLYFSREVDGAPSIFCAEPDGDSYGEPVRLSDAVNCGPSCYNAFVAPDESFLIVCVVGHGDNLGNSDYWISFRNGKNEWQPAVNMGPKFNGPGQSAASVYLSPDGQFLFFSSDRTDPNVFFPENRLTRKGLLKHHSSPGNGNSDIYWVHARALDELRN